ncbi:unnamed protein product [Echinostoma caproni]|uniref:PFL domain-containing protein n=1 Tax=Echinostoma caproni TaxID=27848 RepID=A0A183BFR2_9TREM|nr:unnamed protein product [Echinostoma caproni]
MRHGVDPIESDIKKLDTATLLESAAGFSQLSRMKKIIATWLACATELSQLSRMKTDTDAASRLDPCTGMELVEEVDCYLVGMCHGIEPIESDEIGIGYKQIISMCHGVEPIESDENGIGYIACGRGVEPIESDENGMGYKEIKARRVTILIKLCTKLGCVPQMQLGGWIRVLLWKWLRK